MVVYKEEYSSRDRGAISQIAYLMIASLHFGLVYAWYLHCNMLYILDLRGLVRLKITCTGALSMDLFCPTVTWQHLNFWHGLFNLNRHHQE